MGNEGVDDMALASIDLGCAADERRPREEPQQHRRTPDALGYDIFADGCSRGDALVTKRCRNRHDHLLSWAVHRVAIVVLLVARLAHAQSEGEPAPSPVPDPTPPVAEPTPTLAPPAATASTSPPAPAAAIATTTDPTPPADRWSMRLGGYVQPQFRLRQNSPAAVDEDGFRLARVRLTASAEGRAGDLVLSAFIEAELQPTFTLADAFATVARPLEGKGTLALDVGQTRVPISRQQLISDSRLSFVDKAQLATIAPDRDLGARATFVPPGVPIRVIAGAFNGEGKNQIQNINEGYLYAGRVEVTPVGGAAPLAESAFGHTWISAAISAGYNKLTPGDYRENQLSLGADISGAYRGLSGSVEYLVVRHAFKGDPMKLPGPDYKGNGWMAQLAYLLPVALPPNEKTRVEIGARVEEIDRNDTVPIPQLGDPAQSVREYTGVASIYVREHLLKAQIAFSHFQELETQTSTGTDATFANDQLLLQITYRVE
jgi:hypothetical protein